MVLRMGPLLLLEGEIFLQQSIEFQLLLEPNIEPPIFTLTCVTTGGPPTTVTWTRDDTDIDYQGNSRYRFSRTVTDLVAATYNNTLTVTGNFPGNYTILAQNPNTDRYIDNIAATSTLQVESAGPPINVTTVQGSDPSAIVISWTAPVSGANVTGYWIYYQSEEDQGSMDVDAGITEFSITGLCPRLTYNISLVALSVHLPSPVVELEGIMLGMTNETICPSVTTSPTTASPATSTQPDVIARTVATLSPGLLATISPDATIPRPSAIPTDATIPRPSATPTDATIPKPLATSSPDATTHPVTTTHLDVIISTLATPKSTSNADATPTSSAGVPLGIVIGGAGGASALLALLILVVCVCLICLLRGKSKQKTKPSPLQEMVIFNKATESVTTPTVEKSKEKVMTKAVLETEEKTENEIIKESQMEFEEEDEDKFMAEKTVAIEDFPQDTIRVTEGESVLLHVKVTGVPKPTIVWYHQGKQLERDYSIEFGGEDGSVSIPSAEIRHAGVYKLVATNTAGSAEKEVKLMVHKAGEPITDIADQKEIGPVPVAEFGKYVEQHHANGNKPFGLQYKTLPKGRDGHSMAVGTKRENMPRNKFTNIIAYDDSRVALKLLPGHDDCQHDYINASYVDGYSLPRKFIATQAPLPITVTDFWRLVWQEKCPSIVMLTNLVEGEKIKCLQYWPASDSTSYGPFQVTITDENKFADYSIRTFRVEVSGSSDPPLKVTQFHFTAWPDHGVPDYATPILEFHTRVKSQHDSTKGPVLVHCSAGVGRTGTLITIDNVLEQVEKEGVVDIATTVSKLRQQRPMMVQTAEQYIFIHDAVLESVTCGDTQIAAGDLQDALDKLQMGTQTGLVSQFEVLGQVTPKPDDVRRDSAIRYAEKNRSMDYLPADRWRVVLKGEYPDYINAVFVNGYKQQKAFIIAQGPMESTCRDFWKMICERECGVIVMLSRLNEDGKEVCYQYWPSSGDQQFGEYNVDLLGQEEMEGFVHRTLSITHSQSGKVHQVTQFHIMNWDPDGQCNNLRTVNDVIGEVVKVQRRTGNHPVLVHCSDTVSRSGMFCAIATTIERCKMEEVVDVFQVVKALRVQKPGAVLNVEQYQTVFEAVLTYLGSFDTYANFQNL